MSEDLNLRKAIAYAINTPGIVKNVLKGWGDIENSIGARSYSDCPTINNDGDYYHYDPELAKEYLAKSNYQNQSIRILVQNSGIYPRAAQIIMGNLMAVGINAQVDSYENALYQTYQRQPDKWDIFLVSCGASDYLASAWSSIFCAANNNGERTVDGWVDPELEALMLKLMTEEGHTMENMNKVERILDENVYAIGLFEAYSFYVWNNRTGITEVPVACKNGLAWWMAEYAK